MSLLAALLVIFVALNVAYAALCWMRFRGMPGQRLMSLQVGNAGTGHNLSLGASLVRAVVAVGIPVAAVAAFLYGSIAFETSVPWSAVTDPQPGGPADAWLSSWSWALEASLLAAVAWPALLLIWTAASPTRQGLHDRLAGSLVVGKASAPWAGSAYGPGFVIPPGYGPGAYGAPGYGPPGYGPGIYGPPGSDPGAAPGTSTDPAGQPGTAADPETQPPPLAGWPDPNPPESRSESGDGRGQAWLDAETDPEARSQLRAPTIGRRLGAYLVDCVLVYLLFSLVASFVQPALLPSKTATLDERTFIFLGLMGGFLQLVYFTLGWALRQGTLGQRLLHLRVSDATTGKALSVMDALVRWAVLQGPFALLTIVPEIAQGPVLLGASAWAAYLLYTTANDPDLRGLHDRFLNSRVTLEL
jgi:uncharacterized RDD family membrane protein YckC